MPIITPGGGGGGSQPVQVAVKSLTSAQIKALHASPIEVVTAPGLGKAILPVMAVLEIVPGTTGYAGGHIPLMLDVPANLGFALVSFGSGHGLEGLTPKVTYTTGVGSTSGDQELTGDVGNAPLVLCLDPNQTLNGGPILTSSLQDAGSLYVAGDTFTIQANSADATGIADTVDGGGGVLTYHLDNPGTFYTTSGNPKITVVGSGFGNGLTINVNSVAPNPGDGTLKVTALYYIVTLG